MEIGELVALKQIKSDAKALDNQTIAIGPFARLDAGEVAAHDGKTRGAITNLFGSQAAFQAEIMALALNAGEWIDRIEYADPTGFPTADEWLDAFFAGEAARGPRHGAKPAVNYSFLWALWLSAVPYGMWSAEISKASFEEHLKWVRRLEDVLKRALDHFGMILRRGYGDQQLGMRDRGHGRGRMAQSMPDYPSPMRPGRADRHPAPPRRSFVVAWGDRASKLGVRRGLAGPRWRLRAQFGEAGDRTVASAERAVEA